MSRRLKILMWDTTSHLDQIEATSAGSGLVLNENNRPCDEGGESPVWKMIHLHPIRLASLRRVAWRTMGLIKNAVARRPSALRLWLEEVARLFTFHFVAPIRRDRWRISPDDRALSKAKIRSNVTHHNFTIVC